MAPTGFECGGCCAVSTAGDYLHFATMLLNGGEYGGHRVLSRRMGRYMVTNQLGPDVHNLTGNADPTRADYGFGLCLAVRTTPGVVRLMGSVEDFSWPGAGGTNWWADPQERLAVVFMAHSPELPATMDSDDAVGRIADADGSIADPVATPVRERSGPKPKQRAAAAEAAPLRHSAQATSGQETQAPDAAPEPMSAADGKPDAGTDGQHGQQKQPRDPKPATPEPALASAASNTAPSGSSKNAATSAQPAAQWDRATDTVRFDWAEIGRTASQEGANSRWPL